MSILFSCMNKGNKVVDSGIIDVEYALQNFTQLKTSDLGKTVRYIPLETTKDCLIGENPIVKVLRNYIIIEYSSSALTTGRCLLFNKENGRFIAEIGHSGQDPEAFSKQYSWTDEKEEFIYFGRRPSQLIKYDMKGNFCGKTEFQSSGSASYYLITDSEIIGYFGGIMPSRQYSVGFFDKEGILKDSIPLFLPKISEEVVDVGVLGGRSAYGIYGNWARVGATIINYKNDTKATFVSNVARIWSHDGNIRFKEDYVDTIYTISDNNKLIPSIVFNTGKYNLPIEESTHKNYTKESVFIADVSENNDLVFFQMIKQSQNGSDLYNGLFDKKTGDTKLGKHSNGIEDDLTNFIPFNPIGMSTTGEFISLVDAYNCMEWLEKHPDERNNEKLSFIRELNEDMNPIVILIE